MLIILSLLVLVFLFRTVQVYKFLKLISRFCYIYDRNYIKGYDNKRECDYTSCNYICDDVVNIIPKYIDYSSDNIFYLESKQNIILKNINIIILWKIINIYQ